MKIFGYSERGVLNALFYDIAHSSDPTGALSGLLATATFPQEKFPIPVGEPTLLIEQSKQTGLQDTVAVLEYSKGQIH